MSDSVRSHGLQLTRLPRPWDSPGKNTGVGCHFLLQYMKVESENEVAQSCPTLSDPMDCSLPGSSVHGIFQARVLEWGAIAFSGTSHIPVLISPPNQVQVKKPLLLAAWIYYILQETRALSLHISFGGMFNICVQSNGFPIRLPTS